MKEYASLQLLLDQGFEAAQERIIYLVTAYMDAQGYVPCRKESAEHTVAFVRTGNGWALFDDCADRNELKALRPFALSDLKAVHPCYRGSRMPQRVLPPALQRRGFKDVFCTPPKTRLFPPGRLSCRHAIRWRSVMRRTQPSASFPRPFKGAEASRRGL